MIIGHKVIITDEQKQALADLAGPELAADILGETPERTGAAAFFSRANAAKAAGLADAERRRLRRAFGQFFGGGRHGR